MLGQCSAHQVTWCIGLLKKTYYQFEIIFFMKCRNVLSKLNSKKKVGFGYSSVCLSSIVKRLNILTKSCLPDNFKWPL